MKIFKFRQVDAKTGISLEIEKSKEGPTNPSFPGLVEIFDLDNFRYATVDDTAVANPENYIFEISEEEFIADVEIKVSRYLEMWKRDIYENEKTLRNQVFGKYADTATSSGIYKYQEALNYLNDGTSSAVLSAEAESRGITVNEIATRIVENHEAFRIKEAKIAGIRGKILDRLEAYTFDATDALGSWKELAERKEVIGQREPGIGMGGVQGDLNIEVGYYTPELSLRWEYLDK
jgi:hypothetical protein